jgi:hypothetical protein
MKKVGLSVALLLLTAPVYAQLLHVPGAGSAVLEISVPGCATCTQTLIHGAGLTCTTASPSGNVTCTLPVGHTTPAVSGQPRFQFTGWPDTTTPARFVAICNATVAGGPCNSTTTLSFQNSSIRKITASTSTAQKVQLKIGFTQGLLPDSFNDQILDTTSGYAHTYSSRGSFTTTTGAVASNNTHDVQYSFTYVRSSSQCGTGSDPTPDPFSPTLISDCTRTKAVACASPLTNTTAGITCNSAGGNYVNRSTFSNVITPSAKFDLKDLVQRTCQDPLLFGSTGNPTCRALVRQNATLAYGFVRANDRVNITTTAEGAIGHLQSVPGVSTGLLLLSQADALRCLLHESGGGVSVNPNDNGQFKVRCFGSPEIETGTMLADTTFFGLGEGNRIKAKEIRYNQNFADPVTGVTDGFPDVWVIFDSSDLNQAGISCANYAQQSLTFLLESTATVTVSGTILVAGKQKGKSQQTDFGDFTEVLQGAPISSEITATVGPCNNP